MRAEAVVRRDPSNCVDDQSSREHTVNEVFSREPDVPRYSRRKRALIAVVLALLAWAIVLGGLALVIFRLSDKPSQRKALEPAPFTSPSDPART
jgi:hypothetical protein